MLTLLHLLSTQIDLTCYRMFLWHCLLDYALLGYTAMLYLVGTNILGNKLPPSSWLNLS